MISQLCSTPSSLEERLCPDEVICQLARPVLLGNAQYNLFILLLMERCVKDGPFLGPLFQNQWHFVGEGLRGDDLSRRSRMNPKAKHKIQLVSART